MERSMIFFFRDGMCSFFLFVDIQSVLSQVKRLVNENWPSGDQSLYVFLILLIDTVSSEHFFWEQVSMQVCWLIGWIIFCGLCWIFCLHWRNVSVVMSPVYLWWLGGRFIFCLLHGLGWEGRGPTCWVWTVINWGRSLGCFPRLFGNPSILHPAQSFQYIHIYIYIFIHYILHSLLLRPPISDPLVLKSICHINLHIIVSIYIRVYCHIF